MSRACQFLIDDDFTSQMLSSCCHSALCFTVDIILTLLVSACRPCAPLLFPFYRCPFVLSSVERTESMRGKSSGAVLYLQLSPNMAASSLFPHVSSCWSMMYWLVLWGVHIPGRQYPAMFMGRRRTLASRSVAAGKCKVVTKQHFFTFQNSSSSLPHTCCRCPCLLRLPPPCRASSRCPGLAAA